MFGLLTMFCVILRFSNEAAASCVQCGVVLVVLVMSASLRLRCYRQNRLFKIWTVSSFQFVSPFFWRDVSFFMYIHFFCKLIHKSCHFVIAWIACTLSMLLLHNNDIAISSPSGFWVRPSVILKYLSYLF